MFRTSVITLCLILLIFCSSAQANNLDILEDVVTSNQKVQPDLMNYHVRVETSRIAEMLTRLTKGIPDDVEAPDEPVVYKFWQRSGKGLIYAETDGLTAYVDKMVKQISGNLAIELNEMLLPEGAADKRQGLAKQAQVKTSEVVIGKSTFRQIEIKFPQPTDLDEAFYVKGLRLPQKNVTLLNFDIDADLQTINEMAISTASGLQLSVEIRYLKVTGGYIPERFKVTSPDGKIDDLFEVKLVEIDGFVLPASMLRTIRRPDLTEDLEVFFKDYTINQPISPELQQRLNGQ